MPDDNDAFNRRGPRPPSDDAAATGADPSQTARDRPSSPGEGGRDRDRGVSEFVRRAVAAGMEAAGRSKEDFVRIATNEIRGWLDRLELDTELRKTLAKMVLEVKAEVRFRPTEDGELVPKTSADINIKSAPKD